MPTPSTQPWSPRSTSPPPGLPWRSPPWPRLKKHLFHYRWKVQVPSPWPPAQPCRLAPFSLPGAKSPPGWVGTLGIRRLSVLWRPPSSLNPRLWLPALLSPGRAQDLVRLLPPRPLAQRRCLLLPCRPGRPLQPPSVSRSVGSSFIRNRPLAPGRAAVPVPLVPVVGGAPAQSPPPVVLGLCRLTARGAHPTPQGTLRHTATGRARVPQG